MVGISGDYIIDYRLIVKSNYLAISHVKNGHLLPMDLKYISEKQFK